MASIGENDLCTCTHLSVRHGLRGCETAECSCVWYTLDIPATLAAAKRRING